MNLREKLQEKKRQIESQAPDEAVETMERTTRELQQSEIVRNAKSEGDEAPDFTLTNAHGQSVNLESRLSDGPVVLSFFRGRW